VTCFAAVCAAILIASSAGLAKAQESPSPPATASAPCIAPGPPPLARILSVEPASPQKLSYYVRVAIGHANVAAALQARQGGALVDAFPLAKIDRGERNEAVMISLLQLKRGGRYSLDVVGWEYPTAKFACWKWMRIPLGPVTPA
jgi:hypothetical protein